MELSLNIRDISKRFGLENTVSAAGAAGFSAVDYFIGLDEADSPLHSENYRSAVSDIRRSIEAGGLRCNQTHAPFRFRAKQWDEDGHFGVFVKALEITALLGAEICVVHPLHHMQYLGHEEEIFRLNMEYYRSLIPYCREYGVKVGIENMWQRHPIRKNISFDTCSSAEEFIRYIDTLDSEYMVACLDVGHVVLPDNRMGVGDFIRALGHDRLKALHIHDNDYINDLHLLPYRGKLDWEDITEALGAINYEGVFTYEIGAAEFALPSELFSHALSYAGAVGDHLIGMIEKSRVGSCPR